MKTSLSLAMLLLVSVAQWAVPGYLIHRGQTALSQGTPYRFRTAPVDPADPFRGRYVVLDFDAARMSPAPKEYAGARSLRLWAPIRVDESGFAILDAPQPERPATGDALRVEVLWSNADELRLRLPFDRYYLDESLAPEAEQAYREANRRGADPSDADTLLPTYVTVRVLDDYAVIENLYIDGQAVHEYLASTPR